MHTCNFSLLQVESDFNFEILLQYLASFAHFLPRRKELEAGRCWLDENYFPPGMVQEGLGYSHLWKNNSHLLSTLLALFVLLVWSMFESVCWAWLCSHSSCVWYCHCILWFVGMWLLSRPRFGGHELICLLYCQNISSGVIVNASYEIAFCYIDHV